MEGNFLAVRLAVLLQIGQVGGARVATGNDVVVMVAGQAQPVRAFAHQLPADVTQRVGDVTRRRVTAENVTHVLPGGPVAGDVGEIPGAENEEN